MATISASAVKDLREKTGVGMMEAKKALEEAGGDFEKAVDILRKKGLSAAAKKAGRVAAEGIITSSASGNTGVIIEVAPNPDPVEAYDITVNGRLVSDVNVTFRFILVSHPV